MKKHLGLLALAVLALAAGARAEVCDDTGKSVIDEACGQGATDMMVAAANAGDDAEMDDAAAAELVGIICSPGCAAAVRASGNACLAKDMGEEGDEDSPEATCQLMQQMVECATATSDVTGVCGEKIATAVLPTDEASPPTVDECKAKVDGESAAWEDICNSDETCQGAVAKAVQCSMTMMCAFMGSMGDMCTSPGSDGSVPEPLTRHLLDNGVGSGRSIAQRAKEHVRRAAAGHRRVVLTAAKNRLAHLPGARRGLSERSSNPLHRPLHRLLDEEQDGEGDGMEVMCAMCNMDLGSMTVLMECGERKCQKQAVWSKCPEEVATSMAGTDYSDCDYLGMMSSEDATRRLLQLPTDPAGPEAQNGLPTGPGKPESENMSPCDDPVTKDVCSAGEECIDVMQGMQDCMADLMRDKDMREFMDMMGDGLGIDVGAMLEMTGDVNSMCKRCEEGEEGEEGDEGEDENLVDAKTPAPTEPNPDCSDDSTPCERADPPANEPTVTTTTTVTRTDTIAGLPSNADTDQTLWPAIAEAVVAELGITGATATVKSVTARVTTTARRHLLAVGTFDVVTDVTMPTSTPADRQAAAAAALPNLQAAVLANPVVSAAIAAAENPTSPAAPAAQAWASLAAGAAALALALVA